MVMGKPKAAMKATPGKGNQKSMKVTPAKGSNKGTTSGKRPQQKIAMKANSGKGNTSKGILKNKLNKQNLDKLGNLSLRDKIKQVTEENETPEEAAQQLQLALSGGEKSRAWSKHQTHLNKEGNL